MHCQTNGSRKVTGRMGPGKACNKDNNARFGKQLTRTRREDANKVKLVGLNDGKRKARLMDVR